MTSISSQGTALLLGACGTIGGMERVIICLSRQLTMRRWNVRTIFPELPQNTALVEWSRQQDVPAEMSAAFTPNRSLGSLQRLRRLVEATRPTVVNLHYGLTHLSLRDILAVRLAGCRNCVCSIHGAEPWRDEDAHKRRMTQLGARFVRALIAPSRATREVLMHAGIPGHKVHVIPGGFRVPERMLDQAQARTELGLPTESFIISTVARLVPGKGIEDLIRAVARMSVRERHVLLLIAGDGPERNGIQELAKAQMRQRAVLLGQVNNIGTVYAASDVFALPSHMESFGAVFVEAAFHSLPCVGARVGGVPDVIADRETGLLVSPGDVSSLREALERLMDSRLRKELGAAGRTRALTEFTEHRMADLYERTLLG
jgi:glycosyltransferase involved in cell wall biosynthesis